MITSTNGSSYLRYGYTGEYIGDSTDLVYLRARMYTPGTGRFLTRDTWDGNEKSPMSFNRWVYVQSNPLTRIDPSGHYFWGAGETLLNSSANSLQSQNVQIRIQAIYMFSYRDEESVHAEYKIPRTNLPIDLLDSVTGEIWEIKPWADTGVAAAQLDIYIAAMNDARRRELLQGMTPVASPYNWNYSPALWYAGVNFPREIYIGTDDSGFHDIFAGQVEPGVIAWWKYDRKPPIFVPIPIVLPEDMKWSKRNIRPGWVPQPGYAYTPYNLEVEKSSVTNWLQCQPTGPENSLFDWLIQIITNLNL